MHTYSRACTDLVQDIPKRGPGFVCVTCYESSMTHAMCCVCVCVQAEVYDWRLNWCGFGTVFPNGDMQLATNRISKEEYPCDGVRVVDGENVVSNKAELCCGIEDNVWQQDLGGVVSKKIDTSHCCFTKKEKKLPVQCWVRMPTGCGRPLSQTTTPLEWFVDGATNEASCKARKNDYDNHCMKRDAQVEFTAKGGISNNWDVIGRNSPNAALGWFTCCSGVQALTF